MRADVIAGLLLVATVSPSTFGADKAAQPSTWEELRDSPDKRHKALVQKVANAKWYDQCAWWGRSRRADAGSVTTMALREYLLRDQLINGLDLEAVPAREIRLGMTACGVMGSLGRPDAWNTTESRYGMDGQLVYRDRGIYVYTKADTASANGVVTHIQR